MSHFRSYTHILPIVCVCVCVCVLTWLKISWIWSLYREILLISSLQSHYLNRWKSFKFGMNSTTCFPTNLCQQIYLSNFYLTHLVILVVERLGFLECISQTLGKWPEVYQAGRKVTNIQFQNCDQPEQIAEGRWDVQLWSTIRPSG